MSERGYLDGVPLRLSSKFSPQPRIQFHEIDIHIPIDALQDEYDFSIEHYAIAESNAWVEEKKHRVQLKFLELQRLEEEVRVAMSKKNLCDADVLDPEEDQTTETCKSVNEKEDFVAVTKDNHKTAVVDTSSSRHSFVDSAVELDANRGVTAFQDGKVKTCASSIHKQLPVKVFVPTEFVQTYRQDIAGAVLQPQPQNQRMIYKNESHCSSTGANGEDSYKPYQYYSSSSDLKVNLNLSDFESDTANPFDNVELKSINDMEVLASVLKNSTVTPSVPPNLDPYGTVDLNNVNCVNRTIPVGYNGLSSTVYYQNSSYPNHNFTTQYNPVPYYNPGVLSIPSTSSDISHTLPTASEIPIASQTIQSNQPTSVNSFTRFYFPLLTSMANSRANRERDGVYGAVIPETCNPPVEMISQSPTENQISNSTLPHTLFVSSVTHHQHPSSIPPSISPVQQHWQNVPSFGAASPFSIRSNPTGSLINDSTNPTSNFLCPSEMSTSPEGAHHALR